MDSEQSERSEHLLTSWGEYDAAIGRVLPMVRRSLLIFDRDLQALALEQTTRHEMLTRFLQQPDSELRIVVLSAQPVLSRGARLLGLLRTFAHHFQLVEAPPHLGNLNDSMLIADGENAVIHFHRDHPRSKEIIADAEACKPYVKRFDEIWAEGGTPISATTLGL